MERVWEPTNFSGCKLLIPSDTEPPTPILSLDPYESKKTLVVKDCLAGRNKSQLKNIRDKVNAWIEKMRNGHMQFSVGYMA